MIHTCRLWLLPAVSDYSLKVMVARASRLRVLQEVSGKGISGKTLSMDFNLFGGSTK